MDNKPSDTIAAISTAIGGGIAIIRLSGKDALKIAKSLFKPASDKCAYLSHRLYYGHIVKDGQVLDECILSIMKAPRSYTREDVVEISSHGGLKSAELILAAVLSAGASLAEPGEFTKRAFLNGRIDLSQAQAVIDIINSKTELSHNQALNRLSGRLSAGIYKIREELLNLLAGVEAAIDYPEYDMDLESLPEQKETLNEIKKRITELIESGELGIILSQGLQTVILGRPNVGKSSLLNRILGSERAIVTEIPGTTRDVLRESVNVRGIPLNIVDTAGLRDTDDIVESLGVAKSLEYAKDADLLLYVLDASSPLDAEDLDHLIALSNKNIMLIINKVDLERKLEPGSFPHNFRELYESAAQISAAQNSGIDKLFAAIYNLFAKNRLTLENTAMISNTRDMDSLKKALYHVNGAISTLEDGLSADIAAIDIREAYIYLGQILGESLEDDIIDRIFSKFCLGK